MTGSADLLARARLELAAAGHLAAGGFAAPAISRAYYAAFYAAEVALAEIGETRSRHSGVVAAFGQLFVRPGMFEPAVGSLLRSLFDRRTRADHGDDDEATDADARGAIGDATHVVDAVDRWLGEHRRGRA